MPDLANIFKKSTKSTQNFRFVKSDRAETQNFLYDQGVAELMEGMERPTYEWKVEFPGFLKMDFGLFGFL